MPAEKRDGFSPVIESYDRAVRLAEDIAVSAAYAPEVSAWTVLQHLEHLRLADSGIIKWLDAASVGAVDQDLTGGITLTGRIVLLTGRIPRGRGKAPRSTVPRAGSNEEIVAAFRSQRTMVEQLSNNPALLRDRSSKLRHRVFGAMVPRQWLRFIVVHHSHHERIIADIVRASERDDKN